MTTQMTLSYSVFGSNPPASVPGLPLPIVYSLDESEQPYDASPQVGPDTTGGYTFEFWDINSQLYFENVVTAPVPPTPFSATAWYFTDGGTKKQDDVFTYPFSVDASALIPGVTPIATVNGVPWTSQSTIVPTNVNVVITAKSQLPGYGEFIGWFQAGQALNPSPTLIAAADSEIQAVAFYQHVGAITGTIQEDTDGGFTGAVGAVITATPGGTTKPNQDGIYLLSGLKPGPVELSATAKHASQFHANLTVIADQTITQDITLTNFGTKF